MNAASDSESRPAAQDAAFQTTHWSLVLSAKDPHSPLAAEALEKLCRTYWYPLYAFLRGTGKDKETAEDLTQGFFARLFRLNSLALVQREKGKFRSFLLGSLKNFLHDQHDKASALKRGGGQRLFSLDDPTGEDRYQHEPADVLDPEKLYERRFALALLESAQQRLKAEYVNRGKLALYEKLKASEAGGPDAPSYAEIAVELGMTEVAVTSAAFALRRRQSQLVREEVAHTVRHPDEVDEELRHLIAVISG